MRCPNCSYPLFNLKARECPECGTAFKPSDAEFMPNSVRFCCPHCDQAYYGTTRTGHLAPIEFECVHCARHVHMDEMVLRPGEGLRDEQTQPDSMPWLERKHVKPWLTTVGRSMVAPVKLMRTVPLGASAGQAWLYALVTLAVILLLGATLPLGGVGLIALLAGENDGRDMMLAALWIFIGGLVVFAVLIALWGLVTHAMLLMTGGAPQPIGRTYQALCYSVGANITSAFPCLGIYPFLFVGLCWWVVSAVLMVAEGQRVHGGRASLATLTFPALISIVTVGGLFGLMYFGISQAQVAMTQAVSAQQQGETRLVLDELLAYAGDHEGLGPHHAIELTTGEGMSGLDLLAAASGTFEQHVPIGDTDLDTYLFNHTPKEQRLARELASAALPEAAFAYRLGDFVFTYPGIDVRTADPQLWLVVASPDPDHNVDPSIGGLIVVGMADGSAASIPIADFDAELVVQNAIRETSGLPPLPHPSEVTYAAPAVP